jgi:hypothetical protein
MQNTCKERKKERSTSDVCVYAQICVATRLLAIETGIANKYKCMWIGKIYKYFVVSLSVNFVTALHVILQGPSVCWSTTPL